MAEPLLFGKDLDEEQRGVAAKIIERASAMGVDPRLAVSVAFQESQLRPNVGRSPKGAVGIMQVMPATGKDFGFSMEDLKDPDRNIDAGLTVLKSYLAQFPEDPRLGVVAYNAGPNHPFFKGGDLPAETQEYLINLKSYGAFTPSGEPTMTEEDVEPDAGYSLEAEQAAKDAQEVRQAQLYGGGAGAALGALRGAGDVAGSAIQGLAQRAAEGAQRATQAPSLTGGVQPPMGAPATPQIPPQPAVDISGRPPGTAIQNYGRAMGLGEIEAGRALDMTKQPGGVHDLTTQRAAALQKLQGMSPATGMMEDPTRGGLMVPRQTPYTGPRGAQGEIGGGKPPPVSPVTARTAGALEEVTSLFRRLANTPLMRYALPAAGGALSAGEAVRAAQELRKDQPDYLTAGLSGAGALGGLLSMFPATAPVGIPLAVGSGLGQFARERIEENKAPDLQGQWSPKSLRMTTGPTVGERVPMRGADITRFMPSFNEPYENSNPMGDFGF